MCNIYYKIIQEFYIDDSGSKILDRKTNKKTQNTTTCKCALEMHFLGVVHKDSADGSRLSRIKGWSFGSVNCKYKEER